MLGRGGEMDDRETDGGWFCISTEKRTKKSGRALFSFTSLKGFAGGVVELLQGPFIDSYLTDTSVV